MNRAIELHDSVIERVELRGSDLAFIFEHAYVHQSVGTPGVNFGNGWSYRMTMVIGSARMDPSVTFPFEILEGDLTVGTTRYPNMLPLPFEGTGPVEFVLKGIPSDDGYGEFRVSGTDVLVELEEPGTYIEDFPGAEI